METFQSAAAKVEPCVFRVGPYKAVTHADAQRLLGDEEFAALLKSPICSQGPTTETIYPWNVIDALVKAKGA